MSDRENIRHFLWEQRLQHARSLGPGILGAGKIIIPIFFFVFGLGPFQISGEALPFIWSVLITLAYTLYLWLGATLLKWNKTRFEEMQTRDLHFFFWSQTGLMLYMGAIMGLAALSIMAHGYNASLHNTLFFVVSVLGLFFLAAVLFENVLSLVVFKSYQASGPGSSNAYTNGFLVLFALLAFGILFVSKEWLGPPIGGDIRSVNVAAFLLSASGLSIALGVYSIWRDWKHIRSL